MTQTIHQEVAVPSKPMWTPVFSITFVVAGLITSEFLPVSLLTPIARDLGITEGTAGQMITATSIVAVISSLFVTSVTRGLDRKVVLLACSVSLALSNVLVAIAPNLIVLMLARVFLGVAMGGFWSLSTATALRLVPRDAMPKALSIIGSGVAIANVVAAPLGSLLETVLGWRGVFLLAALLGLVGFVWQWFSLPGMAPGRPTGLATMFGLFRRRQVQFGMAAMLLTFGGYMMFFAYLRPFLEQVTGLNVAGVSGVLFTLGAAGIVGTALSGHLLAWNLRLTHGLTPLLMGVLILSLLAFGHFAAWTTVLLFIWGLVNSILPVAWGTWVAQAVPDEIESAGGLQVAAIQLGMTLGASLGGLAFDQTGSTGVILGSGTALLIGSMLILKGLKHHLAAPLDAALHG